MSLVRIEPIIASAAVTTRWTTREPSHSSTKTMTVQVHSFNNVSGEKNITFWKYRQTFLFEGRMWMFPLPLQVGETMNSRGAVITVCLLLRATLWGYSQDRPSFFLQTLPLFFLPSLFPPLADLIPKHESFVCLHQTSSHSCLFVTYLKQLEATASHKALQGPSWHHVCLSASPKVYFIPARLTEWSSVYPMCWGIFMIYKNAINFWSGTQFGLASLYV